MITLRAGLALMVIGSLVKGLIALLGLGRGLADDLQLEQAGDHEQAGALLAQLLADQLAHGAEDGGDVLLGQARLLGELAVDLGLGGGLGAVGRVADLSVGAVGGRLGVGGLGGGFLGHGAFGPPRTEVAGPQRTASALAPPLGAVADGSCRTSSTRIPETYRKNRAFSAPAPVIFPGFFARFLGPIRSPGPCPAAEESVTRPASGRPSPGNPSGTGRSPRPSPRRIRPRRTPRRCERPGRSH